MTRVHASGAIKAFIIGVAAVLCQAVPAGAATITLNFSGTMDLSISGGSADNTFSGFFTWDPATLPSGGTPAADATDAEYDIEAYQLIFNGVDLTSAGNAGIILLNNAETTPGVFVDGLLFAAAVPGAAPGNQMLFVGLIGGPSSTWNTLALPADTSFLASLTDRSSLLSEEVPNEGDANDIVRGQGTLTVTPVPEPATLTLAALGVGAMLVRARRTRSARHRG